MKVKPGFAPFARKMRREGLPEVAVRAFAHYYDRLAAGSTGMIPEDSIRPAEGLPALETLPPEMARVGAAAMGRAVMIKLNGGLGTGMGLEKAKSLLVVKDGLTFLDIIARQAQYSGVPLVLMDSYNTRDDSLAALAVYGDLNGSDIPADFVQHKAPKVLRDGLAPASWPEDPELEWCPPGHGDIYPALVTSGMLDALLARGIRYAFVSNADNLGAVLEPAILGYLAANRLPFLMEVAGRTAADRKGGHLAARRADGRLLLRESAQCPPEEMDDFQDIERHRYFNTNNLWLDLARLKALLDESGGFLPLPLIRNAKTLDPRNPASPPVYQLETAMGAAISLFDGAAAMLVPRERFAPVKSTDDLLAVRSDAYLLGEDWQIALAPDRATAGPPVITLDPRYYKLIDQFEARFPAGPPSLVACNRLQVQGDVLFRAGVACTGDVAVTNASEAQAAVGPGAVLSGEAMP
jgi:UTP--glucose-1-phosphate uridylyltransferase